MTGIDVQSSTRRFRINRDTNPPNAYSWHSSNNFDGRRYQLDTSSSKPFKRRLRIGPSFFGDSFRRKEGLLYGREYHPIKSTNRKFSTVTTSLSFFFKTNNNNNNNRIINSMTLFTILLFSLLVSNSSTFSVGSDSSHNRHTRPSMGHGISSGHAPLHLFQPNGAGFDDTNNNNNINSDNFNPFPSMMNELNSRRANNTAATTTTSASSSSSSSSTSTTSNVIVDSSSPGFVPTNGLSEKINGYTTSARNGESYNGYSVSGEYTNGISQSQQQPEPQTAPEVNNWTSIMKSGLFFRKKKKVETVDGIYKELCDMSRYDVEQVDGYWEKLLPAVSYLGTEKVAKVYDALRVAYRAHRGQARKSGEPFIIHPVEVATLLAGLRMDEDTVMAGLLHDTVEDTDMTFELIQEMFGETVRAIVEGETKVSKLPKLAFSDYADEQAENLRQMFVAMTDDYRIIIVKLADRLHNMRTLKFMKPEKQVKISRETLDIFAPLAHRMGIWQFKSELEDTAFMYLYPQEYKRLSRRLRLHQTKFEDTLEKSQKLLKERLLADPTLRDQTANVQVSGRMKEIYSLWHKMETKQEQNLDHILDVVALRVIITPKADPDYDDNDSDRGVWLCYHVLGLVQHLEGFQPVPTRVKDYISFPKPNGYQSLHTALILNGQKIEVQIRTSMMHQVAEYGMASHWAYTDGKRRVSGQGDLYNTPWLSSIKEWQNEKLNARDFVDSVRNELLGKRVFVFLRNGKILNLARGATAIDAAFQIHSEVGLNMHGVEINGKPVPVSYELQNGDVVSILTGEGRPSIDWMRYAKSRSTRSRLRTYFRTQQKQSLWEAGKILLMDYLWMHGPLIEKSSYIDGYFAIPTTIEEVAAMLPGNTQFEDMDDLLVTIGKQNDRSLLHSFVSKLFKVPQKLLIQAEKNRSSLVPKSVLDAVHDRRRTAEIAAAAAASAQSTESPSPEEQLIGEGASKSNEWPKPSNSGMVSVDRILCTGLNSTTEFADPEHLCIACLPVYGDEIVGTRPEDAPHDSIPKVHRLGCPHAQRAINRALAGNQRPGTDVVNYEFGQRVDSETLRRSVHSRYQETCAPEVPVKLEWPEFAGAVDSEHYFPCEIVVHAEDRKLLLADCSEIVSELSEIVKTGSQTTNEHATLVFLIKIQSLDDLQKVMNSLRQIRSVMAVERRFGSELIGVSFP